MLHTLALLLAILACIQTGPEEMTNPMQVVDRNVAVLEDGSAQGGDLDESPLLPSHQSELQEQQPQQNGRHFEEARRLDFDDDTTLHLHLDQELGQYVPDETTPGELPIDGDPVALFLVLLAWFIWLPIALIILLITTIITELVFMCMYGTKVSQMRPPASDIHQHVDERDIKDFATPLCSWCTDCGYCMHVGCCPLCRAADTYHATGLYSYFPTMCAFTVFELLHGGVVCLFAHEGLSTNSLEMALSIIMAIGFGYMRAQVRGKLGRSPEFGLMDCLVHLPLIQCCALTQEAMSVDVATRTRVECCCNLRDCKDDSLPLVGAAVNAGQSMPPGQQAPYAGGMNNQYAPGMPQPGMPQPGMPQPGMQQPGMNAPYMGQAPMGGVPPGAYMQAPQGPPGAMQGGMAYPGYAPQAPPGYMQAPQQPGQAPQQQMQAMAPGAWQQQQYMQGQPVEGVAMTGVQAQPAGAEGKEP